MNHVFVGLDVPEGPEAVDLDLSLDLCSESQLDFIAMPVGGPQFEPFQASERILMPSDWHHAVVGKVTSSLDLDAADADVCDANEQMLFSEVSYCAHMALPAVLLPAPQSAKVTNYARAVYSCLLQHSYPMFWLRLPLGAEGEDEEADSAWLLWEEFRTLCNHHAKLTPALQMTADLPCEAILERWKAEQVKCLIIPTSIFTCDLHGRPLLSPRHQQFVQQCLFYKAQVMLAGPAEEAARYQAYRGHIEDIKAAMPKLTAVQEYEQPYFDCLQAPLQPLMDHLEAQTYEVFERDPVKYAQYQKAIALALADLAQGDGAALVVMVVGAGRGPLVNATLRASKAAKVPVKVYAVEKNPNAVITLRAMKRQCDWGPVTIVSADMRRWQAPEGCDILVSELLGSFGDNELSPECLDGAQRFLKPDGVSIPGRYTSYLAPLMSTRLHNDVAAYGDLQHFETSYVVRIHAGITVAEPQEVFVFEHPNVEYPVFYGAPECGAPAPHNRRRRTLRFTVDRNATIHGFAGYFDAQLYKEVYISILPKTHSPDMFSWFPIMFPIKPPFSVRKGDAVELSMWRSTGNNKVWYEWAVTAPQCGVVHNPNGRSCSIGL